MTMAPPSSSRTAKPKQEARRGTSFVKKLVIGYAVVVTIVMVQQWQSRHHMPIVLTSSEHHKDAILPRLMDTTTASFSNTKQQQQQKLQGWNPLNPLAIPKGQAQNLPSIRVQEPQIDEKRKIYGGAGDKKHLGGFTEIDLAGISPYVWKHMILKYGVKSVLDVGCGRGISTTWFRTHGVRTLCVEGSHDAVEHSLLPAEEIIEHDFSRGPWWPADTYSACWAVEFLEHVNAQYMFHYLTAFRKCGLIFATSSIWGGWHHVEVHEHEYWVHKFQTFGFEYKEDLTKEIRKEAHRERRSAILAPTGAANYSASHIFANMKVFVNPAVASLPEHAGLFPEFGCYEGRQDREIIHRECGTGKNGEMETPLAKELYPLELTEDMDRQWEQLVRNHITLKGNEPKAAEDDKTKEQTPPLQPEQQQEQSDQLSNVTAASPITHPLLLYRNGKLDLSEVPPLPVAVWPYLTHGIGNAEALHIEENGITESRHLYLSDSLYNFTDPNVVWVGDTGYAFGWKLWCGEFYTHVTKAQEERAKLGLPMSWPIFIADFTDGPTNQRCPQIEEKVGRNHVFYVTRSIVMGRRYVEDDKWVVPGKRMNLTTADGTTYRHTPLVVRTDTIRTLAQVLEEQHDGMPLHGPIETLPRTWDVSHFWPSDGHDVGQVKSQLRHRVSALIEEMGNGTGIKVYVNLAGSAVRTGRRGVKSVYIEHLLDSKIVVVTQRDQWEDHYRLFEALATGSLVITDRMLSLPYGLQNGTSIIETISADDLRSKILYYLAHDEERLAIAKQGRWVAMTHHRTWHRIEDVIFGAPVTKCNGSSCPFIVHAQDAFRRRRRRRI